MSVSVWRLFRRLRSSFEITYHQSMLLFAVSLEFSKVAFSATEWLVVIQPVRLRIITLFSRHLIYIQVIFAIFLLTSITRWQVPTNRFHFWALISFLHFNQIIRHFRVNFKRQSRLENCLDISWNTQLCHSDVSCREGWQAGRHAGRQGKILNTLSSANANCVRRISQHQQQNLNFSSKNFHCCSGTSNHHHTRSQTKLTRRQWISGKI